MESSRQSKTYINAPCCHLNERLSGECGYCDGSKGPKGHKSWGITSSKMTVGDY